MMQQLKLLISHLLLPVGVIILSLILFNQVLTAAAAEEQTDIVLKDKAIKQELETSETNLLTRRIIQ
jgi:hypothetical protein